MSRLIDAQLSASRQRQLREHTPTHILHGLARNPLLFHFRDKRLDVVAHQKEFMSAVLIGRMHRNFGRRQAEDQPPLAYVDVGDLSTSRRKSRSASGFVL